MAWNIDVGGLKGLTQFERRWELAGELGRVSKMPKWKNEELTFNPVYKKEPLWDRKSMLRLCFRRITLAVMLIEAGAMAINIEQSL